MAKYDVAYEIISGSGQKIGTICTTTSKSSFQFQKNSTFNAPTSGQIEARWEERQLDSVGRKWYTT